MANLVLTANKGFVGVSAKIPREDEKKRLKSILEPLVTDTYGFIARTGAAGKPETVLLQEAGALRDIFAHILKRGSYSPCYTKVYAGIPAYLKYIQTYPEITKITTDLPQVHEDLSRHFGDLAVDIPLVLYKDEAWPLCKVKSMETQIKRALNPQVWLKSGRFSADTANRRSCGGRREYRKIYREEGGFGNFFSKINMEAADEIGRQLRLRNLSGIIIIDFIDMKEEDAPAAA